MKDFRSGNPCNGCVDGWASYSGTEFKSCADTKCRRMKKAELFGSWVESGNEDKHLAEIYESRSNQSSLP